VRDEIVRDRREHIIGIGDQVATAVAIAIAAPVAPARRHELAPAHRAGVAADRRGGIEAFLLRQREQLREFGGEERRALGIAEGQRGQRIDGGRAFYATYRADLDRIAAQSGVPAEIIVAIIGVETQYGANAGKYRALDALSTLAFGYPKRAPFFAAELAQLFALAKEEGFDPAAPVGSYAGAMGWGQFMPSSWRNWGRDGDGDGRRDLISDPDDVFASIANYFVAHGWQRGAPVAGRADKAMDAADFVPPDPKALDPVYPLAFLEAKGYSLRNGEPRAEGAVVVALDGDAGREYWFGYRNFYVITRYNRSPMYAMAVWQLAQAISGAPQP
jgi:membrane-bound lytic murein transglycosylase B